MSAVAPSIVVGTDFSLGARCAVDHASRLALRLDFDLVLAHAWNTDRWSTDLFSAEIAVERLLAAARESAAVALERTAEECRASGYAACGRSSSMARPRPSFRS